MGTLFRSILAVVASLTLLSTAHADGPPIRNGQIYVPHQIITLSEKQVETAGRLRWIELDEKQIRALSKVHGKPVSAVFSVITVPYNDCSCGLGFYGLWTSRNKVQIPDSSLGEPNYIAFEGQDDIEIKTLEDVKKRLRYNTLMIDYDGQVYQKGKLANDPDQAYKNILADKKIENDDKKFLWVNTPPLKNLPKIKKSYINIEDFFRSKGFTVYAHFDREYVEYEQQGLGLYKVYRPKEIEESGSLEVYPAKATESRGKPSEDADRRTANLLWKVKTSSFGTWKNQKYSAGNLTDGDRNTAWVEGVPGVGIKESITFYGFKKESPSPYISGFRVENGYIKNQTTFEENCRIKDLRLVQNGKSLFLLRLKDSGEVQKIAFPPIRVTDMDELTLVIEDVYGGSKYKDTALTSIAPLTGLDWFNDKLETE